MSPLAFWANCGSTGYSHFFMAHGVEAVLPFNIAEATYLLPPLDLPTLTETLSAYCVTQLLKHPEDLHDMAGRILCAQKISAVQFLECFAATIQEHDFAVSSLVLVRNSCIEKELNWKTKPRYLGPMIVVRCTQGGAYILAKMDGTISCLCYAAFHLLPYLPHMLDNISPTTIVAADNLEDLDLRSEDFPFADDPMDLSSYLGADD